MVVDSAPEGQFVVMTPKLTICGAGASVPAVGGAVVDGVVVEGVLVALPLMVVTVESSWSSSAPPTSNTTTAAIVTKAPASAPIAYGSQRGRCGGTGSAGFA